MVTTSVRYDDAEIDEIKADLWANEAKRTGAAPSSSPVVVAEGDSWFDYPLGLDILDCLKKFHHFDVRKFAEAGDTIENMVYGTEYRRDYRPRRPQSFDVLEEVKASKAKVFLFSAGGNDIAGPELRSFLNHRQSDLPPVRTDYADYMFHTVFRQAYLHMFEMLWTIDQDIQIVGHGYANCIPDGRGYRRGGLRWAGPWLRPSLAAKGWDIPGTRSNIIKELLAKFNTMLQDLSQSEPRFHYLDLRPDVDDTTDWENELHLKPDAYRRVASRFARKIKDIL